MKKNNQEWDYKEIRTPEHDEMIVHLLDPTVFIGIFNKKFSPKILNIKTEVPVTAGINKFIVGYIDIVANVDFYKNKHKFESSLTGIKCEVCGTKKEHSTTSKCFFKRETYYVEIKPEVKNFGSLIRQIRKYQEYMPKGDWIVCTKRCSKKFGKALKSQGVRVWDFKNFEKKNIS